MHLFIYEPAYRRLQSQIHAICPQVRPILIYRDCRVELEGRELPPSEFHPEAAWISTDLFFSPAARDFFRLLLGGDSLPVKKPDPAPLLLACERLGVAPRAALMVGDSKNDIDAARAAGCPVVAVDYGYNYGRPIAADQPDRVIADLRELL